MPKIVALTAPSGAGKTTLARRVLKAIPAMVFSVSATTRPPRDGEQHGIHYYFVSEEVFRQFIEDGSLVEYEEVYPGRLYGTLRSEIERAAETAPVLLDIDVRGATRVKALFGHDALAIFVRPPSLDELARRLRKRASETEETLQVRLKQAETEMTYAEHFDAVVVNDNLRKATRETLDLVRQFLNQ